MALVLPWHTCNSFLLVGGDAFVNVDLISNKEGLNPVFGQVHHVLDAKSKDVKKNKDGSGSLLPHITSLALTDDDKCLVVTDSLKNLSFFNRADDSSKEWLKEKSLVLEKQPRKVIWDGDQKVLVADKSGDVVLLQRNSDHNMDESTGNDNENHNNVNKNGESMSKRVILGHFSMLLDLKLTANRRYILTCDRDEKLRISHYPNAYNIHAFCLGHTEFVAAIEVVNDNLALTASGDGTVRLFDFMKAEQLDCVQCGNDLDNNEDEGNNKDDKLDDSSKNDEDGEDMKRAVINVKSQRIGDQVMVVSVVQGCKMVPVYKFTEGKSRLQLHSRLDFKGKIRDVIFLQETLIVLTASNPFLHCFKFDSQSSLFVPQTLSMNDLSQDVMALFEAGEDHEASQAVHFKRWFDNEKAYLERKEERVKEQQKGNKRAKS